MVRSALILSAVVVFGAATAILSLYLRDESLIPLVPEIQPIVDDSTAVEAQISVGGALALTWASVPDVIAPPWSGTVTRVNVIPGHVIPSSGPPVEINGQPRHWLQSDVPLYRPVGLGMSGEDVDAVMAFLSTRSLVDELPEAGEPLGDSAVEAIHEFGVTAGFIDPRGPVKGTMFQPDWVIWAPPSLSGSTSEVYAIVGHPAPPPGTRLLSLSPMLDGAVLAGEGSAGLPVDSGLRMTTVVRLGSESYEIEEGVVSSADLLRLQSQVEPGQDEVAVSVERLYEGSLFALPHSALIVADTGYCVLAQEASHQYEPLAVTVVGGDLDVTIVAGLAAPTRLLINPAQVGEYACTSLSLSP